MKRRAQRLARHIAPLLPVDGQIADVGSGTGHNAACLRERFGLDVTEFDVNDIHWVGAPPEAIIGGTIPRDRDSFAGLTLLYVLHYPDNPRKLLQEAARVTSGPLVVLQSTYEGAFAERMLRLREFLFGRFGFYLARVFGLIHADHCPLMPSHYFTRDELDELFKETDFQFKQIPLQRSRFTRLHRDLYVLSKVKG